MAGNSIARSKVNIYLVNAGTAPSALASSDLITGEITNYNLSGGESDSESVAAFGGFIDKEKPTSQFELSLEVVPNLASATKAVEWANITRVKETIGAATVYTVTNAAATASVVYPTSKMVVISAYDSATSVYNTVAYNNADVTTFEMDHSADDNRTLNLTFKFSPQTTAGKSNVMEAALAPTALPVWSALN
jgi:hypothetical protein